MIKTIVVILHVITASAWFGIALMLPSIARSAAEDAGSRLRDIGSKAVGMMTLFAVLTLVLGLTAFLLGGGFAVYGPPYHTSLLLVLILVGVQYFIIRTGWTDVAGGANPERGRKRVAMGTGIGHLIWLIVLILMFWRWFIT